MYNQVEQIDIPLANQTWYKPHAAPGIGGSNRTDYDVPSFSAVQDYTGSEKSLWDLAIDEANAAKETQNISEDSAVFIIGSKHSGKTSLILRFLDRDEAPKPTVALEYTFGRRAKGHNIAVNWAKDVGHVWELGGGTWLSKLMDIPLNADTLAHTSLVIVLDLSKPNEMWFTLENLLKAAKARVDAIIQELRASNPEIKDILKERAWERLGADHPDKSMIDPFSIPLVIVGGKYDVFQDFDSEKRKVISKTLRFMAHTHGATLQFFSIKQEQLVTKARSLFNHLAFGTSASKTVQIEHNKPLFVPAGQDSLQQIGAPPISDGDIGKISARTPVELWKHAYTSYFPQENINNPAMVDDPAKDPQFAEQAIDTLRAQKDEELERYRKLCERRSREAQQGYSNVY